MSLTKEQEIFLQSLEKEFENRYTEMDEEFKAVLNAKPPTPPVCENYFERLDHREGYEGNKADSYNRSYKRNTSWNRGDRDYSYPTNQFNKRKYFGDDFRGRYSDEFRNKREHRGHYSHPSSIESREHYSSSSPYESRDYPSRSSYESHHYSHDH